MATEITVLSEADAGSAQKRWSGLAFLLLVVLVTGWAIYWAVTWMSDENQLPLSKIAVQGELYRVSALEIRDVVNELGPLQSFMLQDVDEIHKAVVALPWVSHVAVRKQWPDTLKIHIVEHKVQAIWNGDKLLDSNNTVFNADPQEVKEQNLVSLYGPNGSENEVVAALLQLNAILKPTGFVIAELTVNDRRAWRITTTNGIRIELGRTFKEERLKRFVELFDDIKAAKRAIEYVDLRYDTGAAIGWKLITETGNGEQSALNQEQIS